MMGILKKGKLPAVMGVVVIIAALAIFSCNPSRNPDSDAMHPGLVHSDIELNLFKDIQCMFDSADVCENPEEFPQGMLVMAVLAMFADMALEAYPALGECVYMDERAVNFIRSSTSDSGEWVRFINYATGEPEVIEITYDEPHDPDFPYYYYGFGNDEEDEAPFVRMFHYDTEYTLTTEGGPDLGPTTLENIVHTPEDFDLEAYWNYGLCMDEDETPCDYTRPYDQQNCSSGVCSQNLGVECTSDLDCFISEEDYGPCSFCFEQLDEINIAADGGFQINTCPDEDEPDRDMIFKWSPGSETSSFFTVELKVTEATNVIGMVQCNAVDMNQEIKIDHELIQMLPEGEAMFGAFRIREVYKEGANHNYWMGRSTVSVEGEATTYPGCTEECIDADGDGYADEACGGTDCDDTNADVNPGVEESLDAGNCEDGLDNDCDDDTDSEDSECETCVDADGDDYDDEACGGTDCDDTNADVNPGATEGPYEDPTCDDGLDNDCDDDFDSSDEDCMPL